MLGMEAWLHAFLASTLDGDEWSASFEGPLYAWGRAPGIHRIRGIEDPSASLHPFEKKISPAPAGNQTPSAVQSVA